MKSHLLKISGGSALIFTEAYRHIADMRTTTYNKL